MNHKILLLRTDKPEAEVYLSIGGEIDSIKWTAHKQLSETLHTKIKELLDRNNVELNNITHVVGYAGPGSFTGLRIGLTMLNTLIIVLNIPGIATTGEDWIEDGLAQVVNATPRIPIEPIYSPSTFD